MKILAFDIGGTEIKYGFCDENFNLSEKNSVPTNAHEGGKRIIERIIEIAKNLGGADRIGISTAGQVNSVKGEIIYATDTLPGYTGMKIKEIIEAETGIPTAVENDVNSAAVGEAVFGAAKGCPDFICLTYGTGIGGAIFLGGKLHTGSSFSAGEFGHIVTHANGRECTCGGKGCYEAYASTTALVRSAKEKLGVEMNGREIFENFDKPEVKAVIDEWIDEIVIGLKSLIYIFNPPLVVLGGGILNEKYISDEINSRLQKELMGSFGKVKIVKALMGNDANKLGAAYLASKL
ncbi:MAG: ROK family protein [Acutalibacteraceae bacterium]|nr:ROK family protein [Acutalibacteraceae bacterium]